MNSYKLVDVDLSGVELRMAAAIHGDYIVEQEDQYRRLASELFGVPYEEVTEEQRASAKLVAFRRIYGSEII